MILDPTPILLGNLYWITLFAVIVSSASAVLKAGFKQTENASNHVSELCAHYQEDDLHLTVKINDG